MGKGDANATAKMYKLTSNTGRLKPRLKITWEMMITKLCWMQQTSGITKPNMTRMIDRKSMQTHFRYARCRASAPSGRWPLWR